MWRQSHKFVCHLYVFCVKSCKYYMVWLIYTLATDDLKTNTLSV